MSNRITISEFCAYYRTEPEFFNELQAHELIELASEEGQLWIEEDQLAELERLRYWRYELQISPQGIDVIQNLLARQKELIHELERIRKELDLFR